MKRAGNINCVIIRNETGNREVVEETVIVLCMGQAGHHFLLGDPYSPGPLRAVWRGYSNAILDDSSV